MVQVEPLGLGVVTNSHNISFLFVFSMVNQIRECKIVSLPFQDPNKASGYLQIDIWRAFNMYIDSHLLVNVCL